MLPLSYLAIPPHLTLPDEITDQILTALTFLSRSHLANTISLCTSLLRPSISNPAQAILSLDQRLALYLILAAANEDPGLVHHYRRKATWMYEEAVLSLDATFLAAAIPTNRRSVLANERTDARYWGGDWGADGDDGDDGRELRGWVNSIGDLLNILASYQPLIERQFAAAMHAPEEADSEDSLAARVDCRARVVNGVGAWFGRPAGRGKRVSFVLEERLAWREEDILDAYADEDLDHDILLDFPPNIISSTEDQARASTETVWPAVLIESDEGGEAYSSTNEGVQYEDAAVMDIQWPIASREYAFRPPESHHTRVDGRRHGRIQEFGLGDDPHRPMILYNDPDIFQRGRPSTAGKYLNRTGVHNHNHPARSNEWPLMGNRYQSLELEYPEGEASNIGKWPLNEHYIPSDVPPYGEQPPTKANLPFEHEMLPAIQEAEKPSVTIPPSTENKGKELIRKPIIKNKDTVTQPPNNNHTSSKDEQTSSKSPEEPASKLPETHKPVKEPPGKPTSVSTRTEEQEEKIVLDPFLVQSGIWKIL
jgi:hypothetical protein